MLIYPRKAALDSTTSINNRTCAPPRKKKINTMQLKIFLLSSSNLSFPLAKTAKSLFSTYTTKINPSGRSPQAFIRKPWGVECHLREKQSTCLSEMHCQKPFKKKNNKHTHTKHPPKTQTKPATRSTTTICPACSVWPCTPVFSTWQ